MVDGFAKTPRYVLRDGSTPTSPRVLPTTSKLDIQVIFGFSEKPVYDTFMDVSSQALTPYPLIKGYLQNQIDADFDSLKLVVLDADSPKQQMLRAATFRSVLESIRCNSASVPVSYHLTLDEASQSYRVQPLKSMPEGAVTQ